MSANSANKENPVQKESDGKPLLAQVLAEQMEIARQTADCTKRTAVRIALMHVIRSEIVQPGVLLPSELQLAEIMGVSLGTVQAALRGLQDLGTIVRRRGDGTRVAALEPLSEGVWHFRFVSRVDRTPFRFSDQNVWVETLSDHGIWSEHLGECAKYVRIQRALTFHNGVHAGAEMFLDAAAAKGLEDLDSSELTYLNIRPYLQENFGLTAVGCSHVVQTVDILPETSRHFNLNSTGQFFEIHAKAFSSNQHPIYFQRIYVATKDCALSF